MFVPVIDIVPDVPPTAAEKSDIGFIPPAQLVQGAAVVVVVGPAVVVVVDVVVVVGGTYPQAAEFDSIKLFVVPHCPSVYVPY